MFRRGILREIGNHQKFLERNEPYRMHLNSSSRGRESGIGTGLIGGYSMLRLGAEDCDGAKCSYPPSKGRSLPSRLKTTFCSFVMTPIGVRGSGPIRRRTCARRRWNMCGAVNKSS